MKRLSVLRARIADGAYGGGDAADVRALRAVAR
jgi:hypothetical protein